MVGPDAPGQTADPREPDQRQEGVARAPGRGSLGNNQSPRWIVDELSGAWSAAESAGSEFFAAVIPASPASSPIRVRIVDAVGERGSRLCTLARLGIVQGIIRRINTTNHRQYRPRTPSRRPEDLVDHDDHDDQQARLARRSQEPLEERQ